MKLTIKRAAVILAGSGARDGSEIQESILALYYLSVYGFSYSIFAPDLEQALVVDHRDGKPMGESRNMMVEAARIARGAIRPIDELKAADFDILVVPGGSGTARNLFSYAENGLDFDVLPVVDRVVREFHAARKPIGAMCIAPLMVAKILGEYGVRVTLGADGELPRSVSAAFCTQIEHVAPTAACVDVLNRVVTTPAYMYADSTIAQIGAGTESMVRGLDKLL